MPRDRAFTYYTPKMDQLYVVLDKHRRIVKGVFKGEKGLRKAPIVFPSKKDAIVYRDLYHIGGLIARVTLFIDKVFVNHKPKKSLRGYNAE